MLKRLAFSLMALGIAGAVMPAFAAETFPIRFQSVYPGPHIINAKIIEPWTKEVTAKSNGQLEVKYFTSGAIIKIDDVYKSVKAGSLDMASYSTPQSISDFPHLTPIGMAFTAKDAVHGTTIAWEMYKTLPEVKKELENGVQFLTMWTSDRSGLFSATTPILSPADIKGKRVLFWSGGQGDQIKQWGGIPVQVSINDTYVALQRGMGEVLFAPLPAGTSQKIMEVAKHVTVLPINVGVVGMSMNKDYFDDLPAELQKLLLDNSGEAMGMRIATELRDSTDRDIKTMEAAGNVIHMLTPEQIEAFAAPLKESDNAFWANQMTRYGAKDAEAWLKKVREISAQTAK